MSNNSFPPSTPYLNRIDVPFTFDTPPPPLVNMDSGASTNIKNFTGDTRPVNTRMIQATNLIQVPYYNPCQMKKESDDLARKQEEFILRCQYPKRILPCELKTEGKRNYYTDRRRERSPSPPGVDNRRSRGKSNTRRGYRSYSKSPEWRRDRRARRAEERSTSRSPPPHYSPRTSPNRAEQSREQSSPIIHRPK